MIAVGSSLENTWGSGRAGPSYSRPVHVAVQMTTEQVSLLWLIAFVLSQELMQAYIRNHCVSEHGLELQFSVSASQILGLQVFVTVAVSDVLLFCNVNF